MNQQQAMQVLQQFGIGPDEFEMVAQAVMALSGQGEAPEPNEDDMPEQMPGGGADPYAQQIARQLSGGR